MLFFTDLLNSQVVDDANSSVGSLQDFLVPFDQSYPRCQALVVYDKHQRSEYLIPLDKVELLGKGLVTLNIRRSDLSAYQPDTNTIRLKDTILDRQVVDCDGLKVVRANDIVLGQIQGVLSILSIDVGFQAVLRRLGLGKLPFVRRIAPRLIPWAAVSLLDMQAPELQVKSQDHLLAHLHPADIANLVEELNAKRGAALISNLDTGTAADVLEEVDDDTQLSLIEHLDSDRAGHILEDMTSDQVADIIDDLPADKVRQLLAGFSAADSQEYLDLANYDDKEAGGLMTTAYFSVHPESHIRDVKKALHKSDDEIPSISYVYVVDEQRHVVGVSSLRKLSTARDHLKIKDIMTTNLFTLPPDASLREIAELLTKYNLYSVSIVDKERHLLGIVMIDDIMRELFPEA